MKEEPILVEKLQSNEQFGLDTAANQPQRSFINLARFVPFRYKCYTETLS